MNLVFRTSSVLSFASIRQKDTTASKGLWCHVKCSENWKIIISSHRKFRNHLIQTHSFWYKPTQVSTTYRWRWDSLAQMVKHLSTMLETWVQSLGREDLEKEMATHSSVLAWKIPWTEEPGRLQSLGWQRVGHDWATSLYMCTNHKACVKQGTTLPQNIYPPITSENPQNFSHGKFKMSLTALSDHTFPNPILSNFHWLTRPPITV